jgi:hypothetical protein
MMAVPVGLAGEGDAVDVRVGGQEGAGGVRAEAVDHVVDALGDADLVHHLAEQGGGARRGFEGLTTTVLPQASAGPTFQVISSSGRFHGQITPITPRGTRTP